MDEHDTPMLDVDEEKRWKEAFDALQEQILMQEKGQLVREGKAGEDAEVQKSVAAIRYIANMLADSKVKEDWNKRADTLLLAVATSATVKRRSMKSRVWKTLITLLASPIVLAGAVIFFAGGILHWVAWFLNGLGSILQGLGHMLVL